MPVSKLKPSIVVKINGEDREILMTYGLLNACSRLVTNPDQIAQIAVDPDLRDSVLKVLLAKRNLAGKVEHEFNIDEMDLTVDTVLELTEWASNHLLDFFLKALQRAKSLTDANKDRIDSLTSSGAGSQN